MKSVDVSTEIVIGCPVTTVAGYASDPDHATEWYANIKSVKGHPEAPSGSTSKVLKVGSQIAFTAKFLGRELAYVYEIVEFIPNAKFVMRTADGPFPMETTYNMDKYFGKGNADDPAQQRKSIWFFKNVCAVYGYGHENGK